MTGLTLYWKDSQTTADEKNTKYFAVHLSITKQKNQYFYRQDKNVKFTYGTIDKLLTATKGRIMWYGQTAAFSHVKKNAKTIVDAIFEDIINAILSNKNGPITLEKITLAPELTIKPVTIPNNWDEQKYGVKK